MSRTGHYIVWALAGFGALLAASLPAGAEPLRISRADCAALVSHRARSDVTYQAGVDVRGQGVASADLDSRNPFTLPETSYVLIEIDLIERLGLAVDPEAYDANILIGRVAVTGEQVTFNGQPVAASVAGELAHLCRAALSAIVEGAGR